MFSIFHGLFTIFAVSVDKHNRNVTTEENKRNAIANGNLTYRGARGNEYLVENDRWVWTKRTRTGQDVIADMKTGEIYYNLSDIKRREIIKEQTQKGKTIRYKLQGDQFSTYYGKYKQSWHDIDIETNVPVHTINVNCISFYQELNNGMLLRPIDGESFKYKVGKHTVEEIVELFNKRQKEMRHELEINKDDRFWLKANYFFDSTYSIYIDNKDQFNIFLISYNEGNQARWKYIREDNKEV